MGESKKLFTRRAYKIGPAEEEETGEEFVRSEGNRQRVTARESETYNALLRLIGDDARVEKLMKESDVTEQGIEDLTTGVYTQTTPGSLELLGLYQRFASGSYKDKLNTKQTLMSGRMAASAARYWSEGSDPEKAFENMHAIIKHGINITDLEENMRVVWDQYQVQPTRETKRRLLNNMTDLYEVVKEEIQNEDAEAKASGNSGTFGAGVPDLGAILSEAQRSAPGATGRRLQAAYQQ